MKQYPQLWSRLFNTPLLITPAKAAVIEQVFRSHLQGSVPPIAADAARLSGVPAAALKPRAAYAGIKFQRRTDKPYMLTESGIAVIQVVGTLVQRGSWIDAMSGLISYDAIAMQLDQAVQDPEVRAVLLELDSPGGEGTGIVEMADRILAARGNKRVWAIANEMACSAAYWIGCTAEKLFVPITGMVANIGAVVMHVNQAKRDNQMGYEYTFIYDGARKIEGNSHEALSDGALANIQAEVDRFGLLFRNHVARMNGQTESEVRATQAATLNADDALELGFVDGIATFAETVLQLETALADQRGQPYRFTPGARAAGRTAAPTPSTGDLTMSNMQGKPAAGDAPALTHTAAQVEEARTAAHAEGHTAGIAAGKEAGLQEGRAAGVKAERERIKAILGCDEAKDRTQLAAHLALETDTEAEAAKKLLAASPKAAAAGGFHAAMSALANPNVGAGTDVTTTDAPVAKIDRAGIFAARAASRKAAA